MNITNILSSELIALIFAYLDSKNIKCFRAINKYMYELFRQHIQSNFINRICYLYKYGTLIWYDVYTNGAERYRCDVVNNSVVLITGYHRVFNMGTHYKTNIGINWKFNNTEYNMSITDNILTGLHIIYTCNNTITFKCNIEMYGDSNDTIVFDKNIKNKIISDHATIPNIRFVSYPIWDVVNLNNNAFLYISVNQLYFTWITLCCEIKHPLK